MYVNVRIDSGDSGWNNKRVVVIHKANVTNFCFIENRMSDFFIVTRKLFQSSDSRSFGGGQLIRHVISTSADTAFASLDLEIVLKLSGSRKYFNIALSNEVYCFLEGAAMRA